MSKQIKQTSSGPAVLKNRLKSTCWRGFSTEGKMARDDYQNERAKDMIGEFVQQVMQGQMMVSKNMETRINARIAAIDRLLSAQLNEIMHAEEFQKLEGSWRGLHHLVLEQRDGHDAQDPRDEHA